MTSQLIPRRRKLDAVNLVAQGELREAITRATDLSLSTIYRAVRNQRVHGDIEPPRKKTGRKPKITQPIIDVSLL